MPKSTFYTFASLFCVLVIDAMGFALIIPILAPLYLDPHSAMLPAAMGSSMRQFYYGLTMMLFFVAAFLGAQFMGDLSDHIGRKKVLIIGLLVVALSFLVSAFAILLKSIALFIFGRVVGGFAAGAQAIAQAAIIDISPKEKKAFNISLISLAGCLGVIIGPIIGGYFSGKFIAGWQGYSMPFFIAALLALINMTGVQLSFRETFISKSNKKLNIVKSILSIKAAFSMPKLRIILLVNLIFQVCWGIYTQFISVYLIHSYHYTAKMIGHFVATIGFWFALSLVIIVRPAIKFIKAPMLITLSLMLLLISLFMNVFSTNELILWSSTLPVAVGSALAYTSMLILLSDRVDKNSQGMIMGTSASLTSIGSIMAGLIIGGLPALGIKLPFILLIALISLALIVLNFFDNA